MIILLALAASAAAASSEAERLGLELAASGSIEVILPTIAAKETAELIAQHPELDAKSKERLREMGKRIAGEEREKLIGAFGHEYAITLSLDDLRSLAKFNRSAAAKHYREAIPAVTAKGLSTLGKIDFKSDLTRAFCSETAKLCTK
jgi:hypothetical protein